MFLKKLTKKSMNSYCDAIERLKNEIQEAEAIMIGAGSGLSTSAGFLYSGERFQQYFADFKEKYGFQDMYSGGFYPYDSLEEFWAYWSRYIYINRYMCAEKDVYETLYQIVRDKEYFVLTTNVDHCFQKAGFEKTRLFYTQGDYGLLQCSEPCHNQTYDNEETIKKMVVSQGYQIIEDGSLVLPEGVQAKMEVPSELIPVCPVCGKPMSMNLRCDQTFVEDEGWHLAAKRYSAFMSEYEDKKILYLELGVGYNTPSIVKYNFWNQVAQNRNSVYACLNAGETYIPDEIKNRSIVIDGDIGEVLHQI